MALSNHPIAGNTDGVSEVLWRKSGVTVNGLSQIKDSLLPIFTQCAIYRERDWIWSTPLPSNFPSKVEKSANAFEASFTGLSRDIELHTNRPSFSPAPKNTTINQLNGKHLQIPERSAVASRTQINLAKYMYVFWSSVAPAFLLVRRVLQMAR